MKAYVFPGQGAQFAGMATRLMDHPVAVDLFHQANEILGFDILDVMLNGTDEDLRQTRITQPSIFLHSIASAKIAGQDASLPIAAAAGHSLGEFSSLVAAQSLKFEDGLKLVYARAIAMQKACDQTPGTMAAIVGMEDEVVEQVCSETEGIVVAANYNCPGQLVISGEIEAVQAAMARLKELGCKNAVQLAVGGAFHSPLMKLAENELQAAIESTEFNKPVCPIYQNIDGLPHDDPREIQANLVKQLTGPVKWSQIIQRMISDGITEFVEVGGNGKVLAGLIKRIDRKIPVTAI